MCFHFEIFIKVWKKLLQMPGINVQPVPWHCSWMRKLSGKCPFILDQHRDLLRFHPNGTYLS